MNKKIKNKRIIETNKFLNILLFILFTFISVYFRTGQSIGVAFILELVLIFVGYFGLTAVVLMIDVWKAVLKPINKVKEKINGN